MATLWKSQETERGYALQFETDNKEKYELVKKAAQMAVDGKTIGDVVEVRHGKWETTDVTQEWDKVQRFGHFHNNPNCKFFYSDEDPNGHDYCPNCGAKMDVRRFK